MKTRKIPLLVPDLPDGKALESYFARVRQSGWYSNFGPMVKALEGRLASLVGELSGGGPLPSVITTSSGTTALEVMLQDLRLPCGSLALVPSFGFAAAPTAVQRLGLRVLFSDIDSRRWELTPAIADQALRDHDFRVVVVVSPFGYPVDLRQWAEWAGRTGIPVVVDAAAGLGNQAIDAAVPVAFSLHATKALGVGEGGAIATADPGAAERLGKLTNFGFSNRLAEISGGNAKMSEWHAAIGLAQIDRWREIKQWWRKLLARYAQLLAEIPDFSLHPDALRIEVPNYMPLCAPTAGRAARLEESLRTNGIESRRWFHPALPDHPAFISALSAISTAKDAPNSPSSIAGRILCLPFHPHLTESDLARIESVIAMMEDETVD